MPAELAYHRQVWEENRPRSPGRTIMYALGAVVIIVIAAWVILTQHLIPSGGNQGQATNPAIASLRTGFVPATSQSIQPESSSTTLPTPTFTLAAAPAAAHTLETPIAPEQLVIHKLTEGESLESVAKHFNTTVEAIRAANYNLKLPVWADSVIVIPANRVDMTGMPSFSAYQVTDNITIENLATKLSVDVTKLIYYNGLSSGMIVTTGEWLVIPRPSNITPTKTP